MAITWKISQLQVLELLMDPAKYGVRKRKRNSLKENGRKRLLPVESLAGMAKYGGPLYKHIMEKYILKILGKKRKH